VVWDTDLLDGYVSTEIALPDAARMPGEPADVEVLATLVRRDEPRRSRRAVLYVHGWNDYFFQTHLGDFWAGLGYDFYALDLRRYGRSLRVGHLPGFTTDLDDYDVELDAAADLIAADHDQLVVVGHSTGGLVTALWAGRRPGARRSGPGRRARR
jgi:alpha-beta hydrolase superfamily lysophospholipase